MTGQSVDVQSEICNLIYFPLGFIFNFQRLFPVLEEGVFANIALNHDSSLKSLFWISPPRSSFQHAQPPTWGALPCSGTLFFKKHGGLTHNQPPTRLHHNFVSVTPCSFIQSTNSATVPGAAAGTTGPAVNKHTEPCRPPGASTRPHRSVSR